MYTAQSKTTTIYKSILSTCYTYNVYVHPKCDHLCLVLFLVSINSRLIMMLRIGVSNRILWRHCLVLWWQWRKVTRALNGGRRYTCTFKVDQRVASLARINRKRWSSGGNSIDDHNYNGEPTISSLDSEMMFGTILICTVAMSAESIWFVTNTCVE